MTRTKLEQVLERHEKWLRDEAGGERADLTEAYLTEAYLRGADLRGADLTGADLTGADLRGADLTEAYLRGADLRGADLTEAYLRGADLRGADLTGAYLTGADLRGADLRGAKDLCIPYACPEAGSFIGYKKAYVRDCIPVIVELEILADAKRCSATTNKCRCSKAKVLSITSLDKMHTELSAYSRHDTDFTYYVGEIVEVEDFCDDRWVECSAGIHFFINRQEAVNY